VSSAPLLPHCWEAAARRLVLTAVGLPGAASVALGGGWRLRLPLWVQLWCGVVCACG
jgi:hypothetical protein